jgi:hypothetical protein
MGIGERRRGARKGIHNIFNKITVKNFQNFKKELTTQIQEISRTSNRLDQNRTSPQHLIIETTSTENRERISNAVRAVREKKQITYKVKTTRIIEFSTET